MPNEKKPKKGRAKLKMVTSSPFASTLPTLSSSRAGPGVLESTSFKRTANGTLKVVNHKVLDDAEASVDRPTRGKTLEQAIADFMRDSEEKGWDQGYVDSFLENEQMPDVAEVEKEDGVTKREAGVGVRIIRSIFMFQSTHNNRTRHYIVGLKTSTRICVP